MAVRLLATAVLCFTFTLTAAAQTTWTLAWSDEFNGPAGSAVDSTKWVAEVGNGSNGWGNHQREYDTNSTKNASMDGAGNLVIAAYNEQPVIARTIRAVLRNHYEPLDIIVVDDGSTDATESIVLKEGFPVVSHVVNRGQGDALRTGFAIAQLERAAIVINLDADGQYKPEEVERLVKPIIDGKADFVLGSRFMGFYEEAGSVRHIGVVFFSKMISVLTGTKISDCTNGFRAIRVSELHKLDLVEDRFNATEIILEALKKKLRFAQVPVTMLSRSAGETKKPPKLAYPLGVFRVIIQTWLR